MTQNCHISHPAETDPYVLASSKLYEFIPTPAQTIFVLSFATELQRNDSFIEMGKEIVLKQKQCVMN